MLMHAQFRKGWCPGAFSPMQAKDGLIVRLRISGGVLSAATLRRLAEAARAHGNGLIDLSQRGNLQLRGVSEESLPRLIATLDALGLIDEDARAEAVRNVMVSPLAGFAAPIDVAPIGRALEAALVAAKDLHRLPGKFGFLIDDGGALSLGDEPADVRFEYCRWREAFVISIGGVAGDAIGLGDCAAEEIVEMALRLARAFLAVGAALPQPPPRMAALVSARGAAAIAAAAGLRLAPAQEPFALEAPSPIGLATIGGATFFGTAAPFGRLSADMLDAAAGASDVFASGEIRLTPWRALILPRVDPSCGAALRRRFAAARFVVTRDDPRLAVAACGGASACEHATTQTRADALALACAARRLDGGGIVLHVSGCPKGCARPRPTPVTLVGNQGLYDLVVDGTPFDRSIAQNLTLAAAQDALAAMARGDGDGANRDSS
jgi:precorrin-3B synthase